MGGVGAFHQLYREVLLKGLPVTTLEEGPNANLLSLGAQSIRA